jgi:hypothetical protein
VTEITHSPTWAEFALDWPISSTRADGFNYNSCNAQLVSAIITKLTGVSALGLRKSQAFCPGRNHRCILAGRSSKNFNRGIRILSADQRFGKKLDTYTCAMVHERASNYFRLLGSKRLITPPWTCMTVGNPTTLLGFFFGLCPTCTIISNCIFNSATNMFVSHGIIDDASPSWTILE